MGTDSYSGSGPCWGQLDTIADALGTRTFTYDALGQRNKETFDSGGLIGAKVVLTDNDYTVSVPAGGSPPMFQQVTFAGLGTLGVGSTSNNKSNYEVNYTYDWETGRITKVAGVSGTPSGLPTGGANYTYRTDSPLIDKIDFKQSSTVKARIQRSYEADRNLLTSVENLYGTSTSVSKYTYVNDDLGRRTSCVRTGGAFGTSYGSGTGDPHNDVWG